MMNKTEQGSSEASNGKPDVSQETGGDTANVVSATGAIATKVDNVKLASQPEETSTVEDNQTADIVNKIKSAQLKLDNSSKNEVTDVTKSGDVEQLVNGTAESFDEPMGTAEDKSTVTDAVKSNNTLDSVTNGNSEDLDQTDVKLPSSSGDQAVDIVIKENSCEPDPVSTVGETIVSDKAAESSDASTSYSMSSETEGKKSKETAGSLTSSDVDKCKDNSKTTSSVVIEHPVKEPDKLSECDVKDEDINCKLESVETNSDINGETVNTESQENTSDSDSKNISEHSAVLEPMETDENKMELGELNNSDKQKSEESDHKKNLELNVESADKIRGELSDQTCSTGPPSLTKEGISDDNSVHSDLPKMEEPMELGEQLPTATTQCSAKAYDKSFNSAKSEDSKSISNDSVSESSEAVSLVSTDNCGSDSVPKLDDSDVAHNSTNTAIEKSVTDSSSSGLPIKKGQKLDQLLSKITNKADSKEKKTDVQPRQAKARKSFAPSSDNTVHATQPAPSIPKQHSKGLAGLTFNVKELEKTGVLDMPKKSKRKAFEPIKIASPEKTQVSQVPSPVKASENPFAKRKLKSSRRKKGKKMGAYRLPGEKKYKSRKTDSEERDLTKVRAKSEPKHGQSEITENRAVSKTENSDRRSSVSESSIHSNISYSNKVSSKHSVASDNESLTNKSEDQHSNAFNTMTKNASKLFGSGSSVKKAKKTVRQTIDPATHRTLESFLMSGSHSQQHTVATSKSLEKGVGNQTEEMKVESPARKSEHSKKRKASDPHKIVQSSPEAKNVTPDEKKRRTDLDKSPRPIPQSQLITLLPTGSVPLSMPINSTSLPVMPVSVTSTNAQPILLTTSTGGQQAIVQNGSLNGLPMFQIVNNQAVVTSQGAQFVAIAQSQGRSLLGNLPKTSPTLVTTNKGVPVLLAPVQFPATVSGAQHTLLASPGKQLLTTLPAPLSGQQVSIATVSHSNVQQQHSVLKQTLNAKSKIVLANGQVFDPSSRHISGKDRGSVPNGLYPVTPPRTPEEQRSESGSQEVSEEMEACSSGVVSQNKDVLPLCTCKISGASFQKMSSNVTFCQALDSVDGKVLGCCNKVNNPQLVRPAVKIPFLAVCDQHRKRLRLHQCCPGCGHFCTQGRFLQCTKETSTFVHYYHEECEYSRNGTQHCPHCGQVSLQTEVQLTMPEIKPAPGSKDKASKAQTKARIGLADRRSASVEPEGEEEKAVSHTLDKSKKVLSTSGLPLGPDRHSLEKILATLVNERPKKYRHLPKCLYTPAYDNDLERVIYMLEDGHDPNEGYEDLEGQSALHAAATIGSLPIVHTLVQAGASPHLQDKSLKTPLMIAAENNHPDVVNYLIKANATIDAKADDGMTALHNAAKAGHLNIINLLLDTDRLNIDVTDDGGWTPLIWAAEHVQVESVKLLLKRNSDPNLRDTEENTTMHWAAFSGSVSIAEQLLAAGCDLDSLNMHGDRPLHIAARQDHYDCVVLFLARGADVEAKNNKGESPLDCCLDQSTATYIALKVNKQLKSFGAKHMGRPEKLLHRDLSKGRENIPIPCVNGVDDDGIPTDYLYVTDNIETTCLKINRVIGSLQTCQCKDDCSSIYCACGKNSLRCWYDKYGRLVPEFNMQEPPLIFECNRACECWTTCNNRVVQNGVMSRLQVFKTEGRGWGCKTLVDISRGTFICEYIGEHISDSEADRREDDSYLFDLDNRDGETYCIDARRYGNVARFINHLCDPNLVPVKVFVDSQDLRFPRICLFASRDIKAQEELGFDYGEKFWVIKWKQFTCTCGSNKCRYSKDTIQKTLTEYRQRHELEDEDIGKD